MSNITSQLVDELGTIQAAKADLAAQEKAIKKALLDSGELDISGALFHATIFQTARALVNWRGIAEKLEASRQIISANTKKSSSWTVKVSSRNVEAA